jgi:hypothetical protein
MRDDDLGAGGAAADAATDPAEPARHTTVRDAE